MRLYCGTSGFSFKEWKGPFYSEKLPAKDMLGFYASRLPTVEINNTFYRMPTKSLLEGWAAQVPETFRFAIKAPRPISHVKKLVDCEAEAGFLFDALGVLGDRLGAVLVQLPPYARIDVEALESFLALVPDGFPLAFEFRHASWNDAAVDNALTRHGAARVTADTDGGAPTELPRTVSWAYLRLRAPEYSDADLRAWKGRCASQDRAFVYFKHEDAAVGAKYAERMMRG
jgi:uncharacterized protein YecE (DUF72 family)